MDQETFSCVIFRQKPRMKQRNACSSLLCGFCTKAEKVVELCDKKNAVLSRNSRNQRCYQKDGAALPRLRAPFLVGFNNLNIFTHVSELDGHHQQFGCLIQLVRQSLQMKSKQYGKNFVITSSYRQEPKVLFPGSVSNISGNSRFSFAWLEMESIMQPNYNLHFAI